LTQLYVERWRLGRHGGQQLSNLVDDHWFKRWQLRSKVLTDCKRAMA